jgi:aminomethyltransferase
MVDFAGWEMPVQYSSIVDEHTAVRTAAGLFDISHMGRLRFDGPRAEAFLNAALTNDVSKLKTGDVRYSLVCRDDGGILDDVLVYRFPDRWELVVNASNRDKIVGWLNQRAGFTECGFQDRTLATGMLAMQGPQSLAVLESVTGLPLSAMKYYSAIDATVLGTPAVVSRTGYTGEDGFELTVPASAATRLWESLLAAGQVLPAGLGCRDTLRLEAAMPLYGHELDEQTDPLTAGLAFAVKLSRADFTGRAALVAIQESGLKQTRVGLMLDGRRIAREGAAVIGNGQPVGRVTSGTFSPTLQRVIAMAYVPVDAATAGTALSVDLRGTAVPATVVSLPFYRRA